MYKYVIEEFFQGTWLFYRGFDDLDYAKEFLYVISKKYSKRRYRLIEVISFV